MFHADYVRMGAGVIDESDYHTTRTQPGYAGGRLLLTIVNQAARKLSL